MTKRRLNGRQARWLELLAEYDFEIEYIAGISNPANGPSRRLNLRLNTSGTFEEDTLPSLQAKLAEAKRSVVGVISLFERMRAEQVNQLQGRRRSQTDEMSGRVGDPSEREKTPLVQQASRSICNVGLETVLKPVAGATGCKQCVPRSIARVLIAAETTFELPSESLRDVIVTLQQKDAFVTEMHYKRIPKGGTTVGSTDWSIDEKNLLRYKGAVYVPNEASIRAELLQTHYDDPYAGHFGLRKTLELIRRKYYWPHLRKHVKAYIRTCEECQRTKTRRHKPYGELGALPVPSRPWQEISMDFITSLPPSKWRGHTYDSILVIVDRFSKMVRYLPVCKTITASELADIFVNSIWKDYGTPDGITTDRGPQFTSQFWGAVMWYLKVRRRLSTAFHPQTDGQTERQN